MFQDKRPTKEQEYVIAGRTPAMSLMNALMSMSNSPTHMCVTYVEGIATKIVYKYTRDSTLKQFKYRVTAEDINDYSIELSEPYDWEAVSTPINELMTMQFQPVRLIDIASTEQKPQTFKPAQDVIPIQVVESCLAGTSYDNFEGMRDVDRVLADMKTSHVIPSILGCAEFIATLLTSEKVGVNTIIFVSPHHATRMYTKIFKHADRQTVIHAINVMNTWLKANYLLSPASRMGLKHDLEFIHNMSSSPYVPRPRYSADENVQLPDSRKQLVAAAKYINSTAR